MQLYDAGDFTYGTTLTALWTGSSAAVSSVNGWQTSFTPNLHVVAGQQLYATLMFDNGTAAYGYAFSLGGSLSTLPSGFLPSAGANSMIAFDVGNGNFTPPSTLSVGSGQNQAHPPFILLQVT